MITDFLNYLSSPAFISSVIVCLISLLIWFILRSVFKKIKNKMNENQADQKKLMFMKYVRRIAKLLLIVLTALTILQINGVNVGSMLAGLGIASAISGLALQDILKDVIMGVRLISDKFFVVGDIVRYKDIEGVVDDFNVRVTRIKNLANGDYMTICNRNISEISIVANWSDIDLGLSYDEDPEKIHRVLGKLTKEIEKLPNVESCLYKGTDHFESSSVIYKIRIYCPADKRFDARRSATTMIQKELAANNITIPYDQLDINFVQEKK